MSRNTSRFHASRQASQLQTVLPDRWEYATMGPVLCRTAWPLQRILLLPPFCFSRYLRSLHGVILPGMAAFPRDALGYLWQPMLRARTYFLVAKV